MTGADSSEDVEKIEVTRSELQAAINAGFLLPEKVTLAPEVREQLEKEREMIDDG